MMDNAAVTRTWLRSMGLVQTSGLDTLEPLMPILLMDAMREFYQRDIQELETSHEAKLYRGRWFAAYHRFMKSFFDLYDQQTQCELVEKMDEFGTYIWNWCVMARLETMKLFPEQPEEKRRVIASTLLCDYLINTARSYWERLFERVGKPRNGDLEAASKWEFKFLNKYVGKCPRVDLNESDEVLESIRALCNRTVKFIKEDYEN